MNKNVIKTTSYLLGGVLMAAAGLLFILVADLYLHATSTLLFITVLTAVVGGILFLLSESFRGNKTLYFILRGLGAVLSILFIVFLFMMANQDPDKIASLTEKGEDNLNFFEKIQYSMYQVFNTKAYYKLTKIDMNTNKKIFFLVKGFNSAANIQFSYFPLHTTFIVLSITSAVMQIFNTGFNAYLGVEE